MNDIHELYFCINKSNFQRDIIVFEVTFQNITRNNGMIKIYTCINYETKVQETPIKKLIKF